MRIATGGVAALAMTKQERANGMNALLLMAIAEHQKRKKAMAQKSGGVIRSEACQAPAIRRRDMTDEEARRFAAELGHPDAVVLKVL